MSGFYNSISAAASTLIGLIKRPGMAFGRFCGRVVDIVSSFKKKIFGDNSSGTSPATPLNQRIASITTEENQIPDNRSEASTIASSDLDLPDNYPPDFNIGSVGYLESDEATQITPPPPASLDRVAPTDCGDRSRLGGKGQFLPVMREAFKITEVNMRVSSNSPSNSVTPINEICDSDTEVNSQKSKESASCENRMAGTSGCSQEIKDPANVKLIERDVSLKNKIINTHVDGPGITRDELIRRQIVIADSENEAFALKVANFIFASMNNANNPLYTYPAGGKTPSAKEEALRCKPHSKAELFDEIDLFISNHTSKNKLQLIGLASEADVESVFEKYGVILINGLNPEKHSSLVIGCGHGNFRCKHSGKDTLDIAAKIKPDVLLQWGDERANEYLSTLNKYAEIIDEGPLCSFMCFSDEYFASVRSCLIAGGKLQLPRHVLMRGNIPADFVKGEREKYCDLTLAYSYTTFIYCPSS